MKILFITTWYPTKENLVSGVFVREHAKAVSLFNEVIVLHSLVNISNLKSLYRIEKEADGRITEGILTYRVWRKKLPIRIISYFNFLWIVMKGFQHIVSLGFKPDIIHAHIYEAGVPAVLISKLYNIPVVITEHSSVFPRKLLSKVGILQAKLAFGWSDLVLPVSLTLQKAIEEYHITAKFKVVPNVVDTTLFYLNLDTSHKNTTKKLLFVGLMGSSHIKGIQFLFQSLSELRAHHINWHLDIIGDGPARAEYERLALSLGIDEKVINRSIK